MDFGFATYRAARALKSAGYKAFNVRFPTDHRAYFFDFDTEKLFGKILQALASPMLCVLETNNVKQVTQYHRENYHQLEQPCNAFQRGNQHMAPRERHAHAEWLDKDVMRAILSAEKKTQKYQNPAWSVALAKARTKVVVLEKCLSLAQTGWDIKSSRIYTTGHSLTTCFPPMDKNAYNNFDEQEFKFERLSKREYCETRIRRAKSENRRIRGIGENRRQTER